MHFEQSAPLPPPGDDSWHLNSSYRELVNDFNRVQGIYVAAIQTVNVRLDTLNNEFRSKHSHNPIHHIQTRVKTPQSIMRKLQENGYPVSMTNAKKNIHDIAGVRVVCCYVDDIYMIAQLLKSQDDIQLIYDKDYIKNPKENGYRSLHLVVDIPVYMSNARIFTPVEIQIRTVAMDFWASLEHSLRYKARNEVPPYIVAELKECADIITQTDSRMEQVYKALTLLRDQPPKPIE